MLTRLSDDFLCSRSLILSEGDALHCLVLSLILCKQTQLLQWVSAWKHEYEWCAAVGIAIGLIQVEDWWVQELRTHLL